MNWISIPISCIPIRVPWSWDYKWVRFNVLAKTYDEYMSIYDFIKASENLWIDKKLLMLFLWINYCLYFLNDEN